jgi:HD-GYP domain-containing protein (c-di-GMP phosphodiesterase class II)
VELGPRYRVAVTIACILVPLDVFFFLELAPSVNRVLTVPEFHVWIAAAVAVVATAVALGMGVAGSRARNIQMTLAAAAVASVAAFFSLFGLAGPGSVLSNGDVVGVARELSVLVASVWLCISVLPSDNPVVAWLSRRQRAIVPAWTTAAACFVAVAVWRPGVAASIPVGRAQMRDVAVSFTVLLCAVAGYRYLTAYTYSRFPFQAAMFVTCGWLAVTQLVVVSGQAWRVSWWLYHVLVVCMTAMPVVGLVRQYSPRRTADVLVPAAERRDAFTSRHCARVALSAVRLGDAVGLSQQKLRALAAAGVLHHVTAYDRCRRIGVMPDELAVVRSHHERWDGTGYPDRLAGRDIPLLARILAVVDVYDTLTSTRVASGRWTHVQAREAILAGAGTHFDPDVVAVWARLTTAGPLVDADADPPEQVPHQNRRARSRARFGGAMRPGQDAPVRSRAGA